MDAYKTFVVDAVNEVGAEVDGLQVDQEELAAAADDIFELEKAIANVSAVRCESIPNKTKPCFNFPTVISA